MSIVPLRKLTLYGRDSDRVQVLLDLQAIGCMHLIDLPLRGKQHDEENPLAVDLRAALRDLEACPEKRPPMAHVSHFSAESVVREVLRKKDLLRNLREERTELQEAISLLQPWGDFRRPSATELRGQRLWFYSVRYRQAAALSSPRLASQLIAQDSQFEYWVVISPDEPQGISASPIDLGTRPLRDLEQALSEVELRLGQVELDRISMTRWIPSLQADLAIADDEALRTTAEKQLLRDEKLFAFQAWVPVQALATLQDYAKRNSLAASIEEPQSTESPPTLLRNPQMVAGAEGAVTFYMTPGYRTWDPTWIMYLSFSLFFAMIMADAGYGITLAVLLGVFYGHLGRTDASRQFRYLAAFMIAVTIGYGMLIGSYFGMSPRAGSWLERLVWKTGGKSIMQDQDAMMLLAAAIGVTHLTIANLVSAWHRRGTGRALSHLGWCLSFVSALLMGVARLPKPALVPWLAATFAPTGADSAERLADSMWNAGVIGLCVGLGSVFLFSSDRPLFSRRLRDWLWRPLDGFMALTNVSKAFGDALSYLRLFALGLASAQLAITFNGLAAGAAEIEGVGLLLGLLIFLVGHSLNLVLGIVGGVVHGLRLNCIEFFSWSLTDEGIPFRAFTKKATS